MNGPTDQTLVNIVFCSTFNLNSEFIFGVRICATKAQVQSFLCLHLYMQSKIYGKIGISWLSNHQLDSISGREILFSFKFYYCGTHSKADGYRGKLSTVFVIEIGRATAPILFLVKSSTIQSFMQIKISILYLSKMIKNKSRILIFVYTWILLHS